MQHLGINFACIWRFELDFFIWVFWFFAWEISADFLKSTSDTAAHSAASLRHVVYYAYRTMQLFFRLNLQSRNASKCLGSFSSWTSLVIWYSIVIIAMQIQHSSQFVKAFNAAR